MEFLSELFVKMFGGNVSLATFLISMLPVVEIRGAIPFATNTALWGKLALSNWKALLWGLLGSSLIVPIIALIFEPIIHWLKSTKLFSKFAASIEGRIKNKAEKIENSSISASKTNVFKKFLAVLLFVAIPLPFTGVWTGSCVSVFLGLDFGKTCLAVVLGNILAGLIICLIIEFFPWLNNYLLVIFLAIIALFVLVEVLKHFINKKKL